jgi:hypothetical protein
MASNAKQKLAGNRTIFLQLPVRRSSNFSFNKMKVRRGGHCSLKCSYFWKLLHVSNSSRFFQAQSDTKKKKKESYMSRRNLSGNIDAWLHRNGSQNHKIRITSEES